MIVKYKKVKFSCDSDNEAKLIKRLKKLEGYSTTKENPLEGYLKASEYREKIKTIDLPGVKAEISEPEAGNDNPPVELKNNWFTRPFSKFIIKQALPGYFDLDVSGIFAIFFCLLFGIMFGDIGQGLVLILIGIFYKKKDMSIFTRLGIFSIIFGWLYGSIFGHEEIIPELMEERHLAYWRFGLLEKQNTETLLQIVALVGIIFIAICFIINIIDDLKEKRSKEAIFSNNGLLCLLMYLSLCALAYIKILKIELLPICIFGLIGIASICWLLITFYPFKKFETEELHERLHESWELIIRLASSIMNFLLVGCFALMHAFLMSLVYYVAEKAGFMAIPIIIAGNLVVMGIEATEVYEQCLKLAYKVLYPFLIGHTKK